LADVERVADYIAVLDHGVLRANCSIETFRNQVRQFVLKFKSETPSLPAIPGLIRTFRMDREIAVVVVNPTGETENIFQTLGAESVTETKMALEDAFIEYVGDRGEKTFFFKDMKGIK
jgi:ABC-2 type transport system ATP-binding protein